MALRRAFPLEWVVSLLSGGFPSGVGAFLLEWVLILLSGICCSCVGPLRDRLFFRDDVVAEGNLRRNVTLLIDSIIVGSGWRVEERAFGRFCC